MNSIIRKREIKHCSTLYSLVCLSVILVVSAGFPVLVEAEDQKPWTIEPHLKRYFRSHTSYEFGNPIPPYQAPLSRLEFPLDTWWAGGEFRRDFPRLSVGVEILKNISRESDGTFKDSDWTDGTRPDAITIYSETQCRMEPSYMVRGDVDLKVGEQLGLPLWFDLRPVVGVRWQRFRLVAHDGVESLPLPPISFTGDVLRFEQTYWQYFLGIRTAYDLGRHIKAGALPLKLLCQLDWAYVEGENIDHHLLRAGNRFTYEKTDGNAWHASLGLKAGLAKNINVGVEAEYLLIRTEGTHRWTNDVYGIDVSWDNGVNVWSEQRSFMINLEYLF